MGKYMKKGKITGDVAVMEFPQTGLGVRTRAKTLALQPNPELSYLQLRSRRLEKPQFLPPVPLSPPRAEKLGNTDNGNSRTSSCRSLNSNKNLGQNQNQRVGSRFVAESLVPASAPVGSTSINRRLRRREVEDIKEEGQERDVGEGNYCKLESGSGPVKGSSEGFGGIKGVEEVEASFGENNLEFFDGNGRSTRETTPCSLIREVDAVGTPGSADVRSSANRRRRVRAAQQEETVHQRERAIPTSREMDDFFATAEVEQQRLFMEKYNFDVVNDSPLPGRYEWVRVNP